MSTVRRTLLVGGVALAVGVALLGARSASETPEGATVEMVLDAASATADISLPTQSELSLSEPLEMPALTF